MVESDRVRVERARRMSPKAESYLAAHTEDWEGHTLHSVRPGKVLAMMPEDLWEIYENCVAANLVDNLAEYLATRIINLKNIEHDLEERTNAQREATVAAESRATYSRWRRMCALWGDAVNLEFELLSSQDTRLILEGLLRRVKCLTGSALYTRISRRVRVPIALRMTNILTNDETYRRVAALWLSWAEHKKKQLKNPEQLWKEYQDLCVAFAAYTFLLLARALKDLGLTPLDVPSFGRGAQVTFSGGGRTLLLEWDKDDVFTLKSQQAILRLVPVPATLVSGRSVESVRDTLVRLRDEFRSGHAQLHEVSAILLYPALPLQRDALPMPLRSLGNSYGDEAPNSADLQFVPVSCLDINSVERLSRAIRWWLADQTCREYPPSRRSLSSHVLERVCGDYSFLVRTSPTSVTLLRPPSATERRTVDEHLTRRCRELKTKGARTSTAVVDVEAFRAALGEMSGWFEAIAFCPVCDHRIDHARHMKPLDADCFECQCSECGAAWGIYHCGACGRRFPFLAVASREQVGVRAPGWVNRVLGRDVLAVPCWLPNRRDYICPYCGMCPASTTEGSICCGRCHPADLGDVQ
jgi:hypothetical protein